MVSPLLLSLSLTVLGALAESSVASDSYIEEGSVSYTKRSFVINGKPEILLSGAVHYARVPPSDWDMVFKEAKELGLNCIQTYVIWNQHEHKRGEISWEGYGDLPQFIDLAAQNGLYVVVRIGPYICGEYYFGGLPIWLRSVDNISCFRCNDTVFEREMARWVGIVVEKIKPQLITNGGPVIMLQIENEYGPDDDYLRWAVDMARNTTTAVPWNLCHDVSQCGDLNAGQDKVICTINGFWMETGGADGQPGPAFFDALWSKNPNQPAMWTEDQGWFDQWGVAQRVRISSDQIYGIARFFAYGGSYHNFYMLTGGNNYERKSGGTVATAYAPDTVIDNLLIRHQPRFTFYQSFFKTIQSFASDLLSVGPQPPIPLNGTVHYMGSEASGGAKSDVGLTTCYQYFDPNQHWSNQSLDAKHLSLMGNLTKCLAIDGSSAVFQDCEVGSTNQEWCYKPGDDAISSCSKFPCSRPWMKGQDCYKCLDNSGGDSLDVWDCKAPPNNTNQEFHYDASTNTIVFNGECVTAGGAQPPPPPGTGAEAHVYGSLAFVTNYQENNSMSVPFEGAKYYLPGETIIMVNRKTKEVVWNSSGHNDNVDVDAAELRTDPEVVQIQNWGWTSEPVAQGSIKAGPSTSPEQLNITDNDSDYLWYSFDGLSDGGNMKISAIGGTMGYAYVDGKLQNTSLPIAKGSHHFDILSVAMGLYNGGVGPHSDKGISQVSIGATTFVNFSTSWMLKGETLKLFEPGNNFAWSPISSLKNDKELVWLRGYFDLPTNIPMTKDGTQPNQTAVVLNLAGMNKGVAYVNGFNIGRYYLAAGVEAAHPGVNESLLSDAPLPPGVCSGACAPPHHGSHCFLHYKNCGLPTQHLYHIPFHLLKPKGNLVVLFEEQTLVHTRSLGDVSVNILHNHPPVN